MLKQFDAITMIPAKDLAGTRRFYEEVLGFSPEQPTEEAVSYRTGSARFNLYRSMSGPADHTLIGWNVPDLDAAVDELAGAGVTFEHYEMEGLVTDERGVAEMGTERAAWFKDPEGNLLSLWQLPLG